MHKHPFYKFDLKRFYHKQSKHNQYLDIILSILSVLCLILENFDKEGGAL